jgi:hypothetical protein
LPSSSMHRRRHPFVSFRATGGNNFVSPPLRACPALPPLRLAPSPRPAPLFTGWGSRVPRHHSWTGQLIRLRPPRRSQPQARSTVSSGKRAAGRACDHGVYCLPSPAALSL